MQPSFVNSIHGYKLAMYSQPAAQYSDSVLVFLSGLAGGVDSKWMQVFFNSALQEKNHLLSFEFVGHGKSGGGYQDLHIGHAVDDLRIVLETYQRKYPDARKIKLMGSSFGGGVAVRAIRKLQGLERVFLRCPLLDFEQLCREVEQIDFVRWQQAKMIHFSGPNVDLSWAMYEDAILHSAYEELKGCNLPLMICHGTADRVVSIEQSYRLGRVWGNNFTLLEIEGGDHGFLDPAHFDEMVQAGIEFLK